MDQVALGKRIKAARERVGMTQEDLAAAVDYSVDHVSVVELQDSLNAATMLRATELSERLKTLSPDGQRKVMNVLDALITEFQ